MEFRILGRFEVVERGEPLPLGGARQRALLAVLLLHRREAVSIDRLIDDVWGERPPPTAAKTVQVYVSRLRKTLGDGVLQTQGRGYRLAVEPADVDVDRFRELLDDSRAALAAGAASEAIALLEQALKLWRGPPLTEFEFEPFAQSEIGRLKEERLSALEDRTAAQLAVGNGAVRIGELEVLVRDHPLRERLHELLMLALYRSGRQAEALAVFRAVHARLSDELGLAPGPALRELETRILRQDSTLDPSTSVSAHAKLDASAAADRGSRDRRLRVAAPLAVLALLVIAVVSQGGGVGRDIAFARTLRTPSIGLLGVRNGRLQAAVRLAAPPTRIAAGFGAEWATSYDDGTLVRIDPTDSTVVQTINVGVGATGLAVGAGDVWVTNAFTGRLTRVNAATNDIVQQIPVGASPSGVAVGAGAVWVANEGDGTVSRIDPLLGTVRTVTPVGPSPTAITVADGSVWVTLSRANGLAQLNARSGRLQRTIPTGSGPVAVAAEDDRVFVANQLSSTVSSIDPRTGQVVSTRSVAGGATALAVVGDRLVVAGDTSRLTIIDPAGAMHTTAIASPPISIAAAAGRVLVGVSGLGADHDGGTLVVRVAGPVDVDPAECCDVITAMALLSYDSLLGYSTLPSTLGTLIPDLALAVPEPRDHGLRYTFRLRPGLRYSNGEPVRASDFRRGLERAAQSSETYAAYLEALPGALACTHTPQCDLRAAVLTDDRAGTVTLRLTHPDPSLLTALGLVYFAPVPAGAGTGIRPGTGPYRIMQVVPGRLVIFTRNPRFRDWSPAAQPAGYPNRIVVRYNGTPAADVTAVINGHADYTFDSPTAAQLKQIELRFPGLLHREPVPETDYLDLNTREPPFNDVRVRRALNDAIDRDAIAKLYGGLGAATPTCQIIPVTIPGYVPFCPYTLHPSPDGHWTAPALQRARQLIAQSGTRGEHVTILTQAPSGPSDEPVARYVARVLRSLGYPTDVHVVTSGQWSTAMNDYRHPPQIDTNGWGADVPSATDFITLQLSCDEWHPPTRLNNHSQFCDPAVDRIAARAAQLQGTDPAAADRLWAHADRIITNLAPWLTTVSPVETDLVSARTGNFNYVPINRVLLDQLWIR